MADSVVEHVRAASAKLRSFVAQTQNALAGRGSFNASDVRAIAEPVGSVQPIIEEAESLCVLYPDLPGELETYKGNLEEIQIALEQMRMMLVARRAHIEAARGHLATLGMWNNALRLTR